MFHQVLYTYDIFYGHSNMFATYSTTPPSAYNPTSLMDCYHPTLPTQMRNTNDYKDDGDEDNNNNDGSSLRASNDGDDTTTKGAQPTQRGHRPREQQAEPTQQQQ